MVRVEQRQLLKPVYLLHCPLFRLQRKVSEYSARLVVFFFLRLRFSYEDFCSIPFPIPGMFRAAAGCSSRYLIFNSANWKSIQPCMHMGLQVRGILW